jgi:hypothetical protein
MAYNPDLAKLMIAHETEEYSIRWTPGPGRSPTRRR